MSSPLQAQAALQYRICGRIPVRHDIDYDVWEERADGTLVHCNAGRQGRRRRGRPSIYLRKVAGPSSKTSRRFGPKGMVMSESPSHNNAKNKAAGKGGQTEVPVSRNRRLDALTHDGKRATEVERSGDPAMLEKAARRLRASEAPQRVLQVPQNDMQAAIDAMRQVGVTGTVKNLGGTKSRSVRPPK